MIIASSILSIYFISLSISYSSKQLSRTSVNNTYARAASILIFINHVRLKKIWPVASSC